MFDPHLNKFRKFKKYQQQQPLQFPLRMQLLPHNETAPPNQRRQPHCHPLPLRCHHFYSTVKIHYPPQCPLQQPFLQHGSHQAIGCGSSRCCYFQTHHQSLQTKRTTPTDKPVKSSSPREFLLPHGEQHQLAHHQYQLEQGQI